MLFGRILKAAAVTRFLVVLVAVLACSFQLLDLENVDQFFNFHIAHNFSDKLPIQVFLFRSVSVYGHSLSLLPCLLPSMSPLIWLIHEIKHHLSQKLRRL